MMKLKICVVVGSQRKKSQSRKVGDFCKETLEILSNEVLSNKSNQVQENNKNFSHILMDLAELRFPIWHQDPSDQSEEKQNLIWEKVKLELKSSHGFVFVVPEWGGMVPPIMKNFFLLVGTHETEELLYHKPAIIVAVSSGINGAYPIAELRTSSYKNTHILYLTEHIIVREVGSVLNSKVKSQREQYLRERIKYAMNVLLKYSQSLYEIRKSKVLNQKKYPYGM